MDNSESQGKPLPKVAKYDFVAEPFHCDFGDRLFMGHLGNAMLNAADFHSNERGYGMHYLNTVHRTWVLSRLAMEMSERPKAYDRFSIETWVDAVMRFFTSRNFSVLSGDDGRVIGHGRSIWAMIDVETRHPVNLFDVRGGLIRDYVDADRTVPMEKPSHVRLDGGETIVRSLDTYYSDVDPNGHVNSVRYIEHVLDLFPIDHYRTHALRRFEIAYVAEGHEGDRLNFYRGKPLSGEYVVRITKGRADETEVARCRLCFAKI